MNIPKQAEPIIRESIADKHNPDGIIPSDSCGCNIACIGPCVLGNCVGVCI